MKHLPATASSLGNKSQEFFLTPSVQQFMKAQSKNFKLFHDPFNNLILTLLPH